MALDHLHTNHIIHRDVKVSCISLLCYSIKLFFLNFIDLFADLTVLLQCSNIFLTKEHDIRLGNLLTS